MNASQIYIAIAILTLFVLFILLFVMRRANMKSSLSPLAGLAFAFVLAGLFFGDDRMPGYGLMGIGVVIAIIDIVKQLKKSNNTRTAGDANS